jgi:hypothetical protein
MGTRRKYKRKSRRLRGGTNFRALNDLLTLTFDTSDDLNRLGRIDMAIEDLKKQTGNCTVAVAVLLDSIKSLVNDANYAMDHSTIEKPTPVKLKMIRELMKKEVEWRVKRIEALLAKCPENKKRVSTSRRAHMDSEFDLSVP